MLYLSKFFPWETDFIKSLQTISNTVLDYLFYGITQLGSEYMFIVVLAVLFWCFDKKFAMRFAFVTILTSGVVNVLKEIIARPRPFKEGARSIFEETVGYSMPSGHSQSAATVATMMSIRYRSRGKWVVPVLVSIMLLVGFSRLYLGQHFPTDVLAGFLLGAGLAILLNAIFKALEKHEDIVYICASLLTLLLLISPKLHETFAMFGLLGMGLTLGYILEKRFVKYEVKEKLWVQLLKIVIGLALALVIKEGFKPLLNLFDCTDMVSDMIRYFCIGIFGALGAPALFKALFKKTRGKSNDKKGEAAAV